MPHYAAAAWTATGSSGCHERDSTSIGPPSLLNSLLIYIGYTVNVFGFFLYAFLAFEGYNWLVALSEARGWLRLHATQRLFVDAVLSACVSFTWARYLSQGFDGDAFSHVLYWKYRMINTREMTSRFLGCISAGALFGIASLKLLWQGVSVQFRSAPNTFRFLERFLLGRYKCKTFSEQLLIKLPHASHFSVSSWKSLVRFGRRFTGGAIAADFGDPLRHTALLLENFVFEFCFCLAVYLVLVITVVAYRFGDCNALYIIYKRSVVFTANAYLRDFDSSVSLDASISVRRFFDERSLSLLAARVLANFLAVLAAERYFTPMRRLRHHDFVDIFPNLSNDKKHAMQPKGGSRAFVNLAAIADEDIRLTPLPRTPLGRCLRRVALLWNKDKKD
ncbi:uncharacterized protein BcabD6B2_09170 [Babesia caballi]|uniref:Membrane protein, putative n=1 Tax=Babesia caballi TaxID=5871 RepID=A0AAV4LPE1_BABCB|nr:membrane protein, putative [Babesia caballi]